MRPGKFNYENANQFIKDFIAFYDLSVSALLFLGGSYRTFFIVSVQALTVTCLHILPCISLLKLEISPLVIQKQFNCFVTTDYRDFIFNMNHKHVA